MKLLDLINEQSIGYTPDKMEQLLSEAMDYSKKFNTLYESTYFFVVNLTIKECIDTMDECRIKLKRLEEFKVAINAKYEKYYQILDTFEVGEYPPNVTVFSRTIDDIDSMMQDYDNLLDALKDIISNSDYISR